MQMHFQGLPWPSILVESGAKNLLETNGATVVVGCYVANTDSLVAPATTCKGNSDPEFINGSGNLSQVASKVHFTGQSDRLECEGETITERGKVKYEDEGITEQSLNTMAYGEVPAGGKQTSDTGQATLEVKNP